MASSREIKASNLSCAGNVDSGFVNGVKPVGRGGEPGRSMRTLSLIADGGDTYVMPVVVWAEGSGRVASNRDG